jgi:hypothetical protein
VSEGTEQVLDTLTWTKQKHTFKFGGDFRALHGLYTNVFANQRMGTYTFNGSVLSTLLGDGAATPFASFLLGYPDYSEIATVINGNLEGYARHYATFIQDDWKVSRSFTLNVGLRYEYHPNFRDHLNNEANFLPDYYSVQNGQTVRGAVVIPNQSTFAIVDPGFTQSIAPTPILTARRPGFRNRCVLAEDGFRASVGFRLAHVRKRQDGVAGRLRALYSNPTGLGV